MALIKGFSVIEGLKGKLGNVVVQKGQYGEQVVRAYVSEIKNPKSIAQSNQRMKVAPAQYARRAMKEIIDHSFEGVPYGTASLNHFLSLAMKGNATPAQLKGDMRFIPGKYQMSTGSLPPITVDLSSPAGFIMTSLKATGTANTVGAISNLLLLQNAQIAEGDRITVCFVIQQTIEGKNYYTFKYDRFNVLPSDTTATGGTGFYVDEGKLLYVPWTNPDGKSIAAACVILSRQSGANWLRSESVMTVSDDVENSFFSSLAIQDSIASYTAVAKGTFSDYYMNEGEANILRFSSSKASGLGGWSELAGQVVLPTAIVVEGGVQKLAVFAVDNELIGMDGKPATYKEVNMEEPVTLDARAVNADIVILEWKDEYLQYI